MNNNGSTPEQRARAFFRERAEAYHVSTVHADPESLAQIVAAARPSPGDRVLDVATGTGHLAFALAPHVQLIAGVDLTPEMLAVARRVQPQKAATNVTFAVADAHELPFGENTFDLVTCRRGAHHFSEIELALDEMFAVLRPGGRLILEDRSVPESNFVITCMNKLDKYHDPSHVWEYPPPEWAAMLAGAGFDVESIEPYTCHRPLSSLTAHAPGDGAYQIYRVLDRLNAYQRSVLNLVEVAGEPHINHWYVRIAARKPDSTK